ncbi:MAG: hybrid sensor histidine kinase/response regulator [Duganella sp.]
MMETSEHPGEILIVEDTPSSLKLLADLLTREGYVVRVAPDGELALRSAQSRPPELILLDVRMPGIDGFEVCRRLKQMPDLRDVPVIFLSAQSDTDDKLRGFQAGAIDFIGKPYQPEEVLARTSAHLALARSRRALAATNAELTATLEQLNATREELRRAERLAALGAMVAGVAHELNTPIGNCVLAASDLDQRARAFAVACESGLRRSELNTFVADTVRVSELLLRNMAASARLIDSFKQVASDQAGFERRSFDLAELVAQVSQAASLRRAEVALEAAAAPGGALESFPGALAQVLDQLLFNALIHGFPDGAPGAVRIDADSDGVWLQLRVCDNGAGIKEADLNRVFEPFFTTRMGQGSNGLGLYIVHNLVTNVLGGNIRVESRPGETCFILRLPCIAPTLVHRQGADPASPRVDLAAAVRGHDHRSRNRPDDS